MVETKTIKNFFINMTVLSMLYLLSISDAFRQASNNWLFWFFTTFSLATIQTIIQNALEDKKNKKKGKDKEEEYLTLGRIKW